MLGLASIAIDVTPELARASHCFGRRTGSAPRQRGRQGRSSRQDAYEGLHRSARRRDPRVSPVPSALASDIHRETIGLPREDARLFPSIGNLEINDFPHPDSMLEATRLTRAGRLAEATALLQCLLRGEPLRIAPAEPLWNPRRACRAANSPHRRDAPCDRGDGSPAIFSRGARHPRRLSKPRHHARRPAAHARGAAQLARAGQTNGLRTGIARLGEALCGAGHPTGRRKVPCTPYSNQAGNRAYKLYIPSRYQGQALPLIVMLHGCTQSPDDFAAGTRMNLIAEEQTCLVVYPAQPSEANPAKCWNWFRPSDQRRGQGEPSLVAGITRQVMREYSVDPQRVYIGGLSAGAAAAAVMGATYPDLYAAIGVHSGLACGAANDLPSAFVAMRQGGLAAASGSGDISAVLEHGPAVPTIVFHGDRDNTVHPRNGDHVIAQSMKTTNLQKKVHRGRVPGGHAYTRTIHTDGSGRAIFEHWEIHGAGHAWSGGSPAGSYTDPRGPDAAREMLRFFLEHPGPTAAP